MSKDFNNPSFVNYPYLLTKHNRILTQATNIR